MKRKAALIVLILLIGIPTYLMFNALRREQASRDLLQAIKRSNPQAAIAALRNGANPNARDYSMDKPLSLGEQMKEFLTPLLRPALSFVSDLHPTALQLLLNPIYNDRDKDEKVDVRFGVRVLKPYTITTAMFNDEKASFPLVEALLNAGADPNVMNEEGDSLLMLAELHGHPQAGRLLLLHGANVHKKDSLGRTALHWAARNGTNAAIDTLLEAGAYIDAKDAAGDTPLHLTFDNSDDKATFRSLIRHHADVKAQNIDGDTPLHSAMHYADPDLVDLLVKSGADVNAKNKAGWTPLHMAVTYRNSYRNIEVVKELLHHHADIFARTLDRKTPLDTAEDPNAIVVLKKVGAKAGHDLDTEHRSQRTVR